jgi:histidinol-phosphatase
VTAGLDAELDFALALADVADAITLPGWRDRSFSVETKPDRSEVTAIDRDAEAAIVARIVDERSEHAVFGEEGGHVGGGREWCWIIDPIDGTSGFTRGLPVWGTLIALARGDEVVVGVVSAPALGHRWWAAEGMGAFVDGRPCRVSTVDRLDEAQVSVTINDAWVDAGGAEALARLSADARRGRGFGDFWQHVLVAEGALDVAVDAIGVAPYDLAAPRIIVEQAGGVFTDRFGRATHEHDSAISSNGLLHADVLARLGG